MSRKLERTFSVSVPVETVWKTMTDPEELNRWYFPFRLEEDGTAHTEILGQDRRSEVVEADPPHRLHMRNFQTGREGWPHLPASERDMVIVLEATDTGTRVTITHSGFGDGDDWDQALAATTRGVEETIADLVLYLETGVGVRRHPSMGPVFHGIGFRDRQGNLEVRSVQPGTFAEALGLRAGDVLVELDGAAVFGPHELNFFNRAHRVGDEAEAAWVRDGELRRGSAKLGARPA